MTVTPQFDDSPEFVGAVEQVTRGLFREYQPATLVLIKIDNWFGSKWLGFSGKTLGAVGSWHRPLHPEDSVRIPPFVPNRVVSQRRFASPLYEEISTGKPIHTRISSDLALVRKATTNAPNVALVWYSGNSKVTGRGAVMAYVPVQNTYWSWYAAWKASEPWQLAETWDIKRETLLQLMST